MDDLYNNMALAAKTGQLKYTHDGQTGYKRKRSGNKFKYLNDQGRAIVDEADLERIKSLAIPPAWTDVWICSNPEGHLQATGRDAKNRKQYRYHKKWREVRDVLKYGHMIDFAKALPVIRKRVEADISTSGLGRYKVLATVVQLLENTLIRVGNAEYAKNNNSFGLTTLRNRHVEVNGSHIEFHFKGKSKVDHTIKLHDLRLARIIQRMKYLPGKEVFQYVDEGGNIQLVDSNDVNAYLYEVSGHHLTAKDFRTWYGTIHTALSLRRMEKFETQKQAKKNINEAIKTTALKLGNTPAICKKSYVHPLLISSYLKGDMDKTLQSSVEVPGNKMMEWIERRLLHLLQLKNLP